MQILDISVTQTKKQRHISAHKKKPMHSTACLFSVLFSSVMSGGQNNVGWGVNLAIVDGEFILW